MSQRTLTQRIDLGDAHQMVLELRPAHDPAKAWGFVGVAISVEDLSASVFLQHVEGPGELRPTANDVGMGLLTRSGVIVRVRVTWPLPVRGSGRVPVR
jgi:hypothetical protein